ncbi:MAG TPA: DUF4625 domain-containing protein [Prolixibacteraceae bacterium]|jgi:hypothetical protein
MKTAVIFLIVTSLLIILASSCKKGGSTPDPIIPDTTKPTISITNPTPGQIFIPGNTITFQAIFADEVKISSYKIEISNLPPVGFVLKNVLLPVPWSYTKGPISFDSGIQQKEISLSDITIPLLIGTNPVTTGKYYFKVTCVDGSNNSFSKTIEININ